MHPEKINHYLLSTFSAVLLIGLPERSSAQAQIDPPKKYQAAVQALEAFINREVENKRLPALSIALIDDQSTVWAKGFGYANPKSKTPATAATVYRVGSVSKLFTDIAIMRLVEEGKLDLDAPVAKYLPDFKPDVPLRESKEIRPTLHKAITLRHLMTHRSGLVREPPVGNYFDPSNPSLEQSVLSLNQTRLVYEPETRINYSNAAIAAVGLVLQRTQKEPFARYLQRTLLQPLGFKNSGFEPTEELLKNLAVATMWTLHGREFEAPTFELGIAPAGCMYSTVTDLAHFVSILFARGQGPNGTILKPETLEKMWMLQFAKPEDKRGFGIGFHIEEFEGHRRIGHTGAIYGFSTDLSALPAEKLGVVVIASKDGAFGVTTHIADVALRQLLAVRQSKPLPAIEETNSVGPELARHLAGRYRAGDREMELLERSGKLWALPLTGGFRTELRAPGSGLIADDPLAYGPRVNVKGDRVKISERTYERVPSPKPNPLPPKWAGLIGEYGWDHNTLFILERDGRLYSLIEWFFLDPLKEISENVFQFPRSGLYMDEKLVFTRDANGRATQVVAANVTFKRRAIAGENDEVFRIKPLRPVDELRREALAAKPPEEKGDFRKPDLVDLTKLDDTIKLDIRYATTDNFLSTPFYKSAKAYLQRPAAEALVRVHRKLAEQGYGLMIHDGYRPWYVTKMFWEATPEPQRIFVADPAKGSRHNRGCAVDLTLYDRRTGKPVEMVGGYDEMSDRSYPDYLGGTSLQRWHRDLLRRAMEDQGFSVYEAEWWHFDYKDWQKYPILNLTFEEIDAMAR
jgi:CubicO group peptidase (beta-lactamase class C family)/D-alanyl-D-alanine dipeptidase